jgi:hypothetical protein
MDSDCTNPPNSLPSLTPHCATGMLAAGVNLPHGYCVSTGCDPLHPVDSCGGMGGYGVCAGMSPGAACVRRCTLPSAITIYGGPCHQTHNELGCYLDSMHPSTTGICFPDCAADSSICGTEQCVPDFHICLQQCGVSMPACPTGLTCRPLPTTPPRMYCQM